MGMFHCYVSFPDGSPWSPTKIPFRMRSLLPLMWNPSSFAMFFFLHGFSAICTHLKWEKAGHPFCQIWGPGSQYVARLGKHSLLPPGFRHECYMNVLWMFLLFSGDDWLYSSTPQNNGVDMLLVFLCCFFVMQTFVYLYFCGAPPVTTTQKCPLWRPGDPIICQQQKTSRFDLLHHRWRWRWNVLLILLVGCRWGSEGGPPAAAQQTEGGTSRRNLARDACVKMFLRTWCGGTKFSSNGPRQSYDKRMVQGSWGWAWCNWCVGLSPKSDTCTVSSTPGWCSSRRV